MTSHVITSFDSHHTIYNKRNYIQTIYSTNPLYHPCLTTLPIPSIDLCENLLYENQNSTPSSSSFINSINEHYDNAFMNTYDNPIEYHESYIIKQSLINIPDTHENPYDNTNIENLKDHEKSSNKSSVLCYLENKRLAFYVCLTSLILLLTIAIGIFLLNKYIRPIVIHTTVNHHYDIMNISNITVTPITYPVTTTTTVAVGHLPFPYSTCPSDRWGIGCQNICKPCGLGVCHSITGKCICPMDIYGEFCDLWKVNDTPKRGDMTN